PVVESRIIGLAAALIFFFALLLLRLFYLQIVEGADLLDRSMRNSIRTERVEASRGEIVDREGRILATTRPAFQVAIVHSELVDVDRTYETLGFLLDRDPRELRERVGEPTGRDRFRPIVIASDLDRGQLARVEAHRHALPGVVIESRPRRLYLAGDHAAHLLGSIGQIRAHQLADFREEGYRPRDIVGQSGLELGFESHLRGRSGGRNRIVDVAGREVEVLDEVEAVPGGRVVLSLDLDIQQVAVDAFRSVAAAGEARAGAVVVLDPRNGDVLAMLSEPAYEPNLFADGIEPQAWNALREDPGRPLQNRAIAGRYAPGSTFKSVLAAAALESDGFDPDDDVYCPGYFRLGTHVYHCWNRQGHGAVGLVEALLRSCDVYFYRLGLDLGIDRISGFARELGLGDRTGVALGGENAGLVPDREWKRRERQEDWQKGETVLASIGQGFNLVTPVQLAVAYAALANGGQRVIPRLVERLETWDGEVVQRVPPEVDGRASLETRNSEVLTDALVQAVQGRGGTGSRAQVPGIVVAGKTGTTQVVSLGALEGIPASEIPLRLRDHALFAAFAPADAPEIVVVVVVEHGSSGGKTAAPIARSILERYFEKKGDRDAAKRSTRPEEGSRAEN
ncbi:MAG: penicillin-binding protein 2, partial [Myxococcota bacterium]|nr:penicillin-binding protein 2 [Myxococcota bacterium]